MKERFSEEQIIGMLREHEAGARSEDLCRRHGIARSTFFKWKARYGGLDVPEAKKLKTLQDENGKLKRLLAEAMLDNAALKDLSQKLLRPAQMRQAVRKSRVFVIPYSCRLVAPWRGFLLT